jgi:hypothetical protein
MERRTVAPLVNDLCAGHPSADAVLSAKQLNYVLLSDQLLLTRVFGGVPGGIG